jgi:hypothetical protein
MQCYFRLKKHLVKYHLDAINHGKAVINFFYMKNTMKSKSFICIMIFYRPNPLCQHPSPNLLSLPLPLFLRPNPLYQHPNPNPLSLPLFLRPIRKLIQIQKVTKLHMWIRSISKSCIIIKIINIIPFLLLLKQHNHNQQHL